MSRPDVPAELKSLLEYIRTSRGFDFTGYKRPSLQRRIGKQMQTHQIASYEEYRRYLEAHPEKFVDLFNTILINVTSFFRDQVAWDYLRDEVVPRVLEARTSDEPIRIWSTGCASGEEAYTLAMIFAEATGEDDFRMRVKVYATDVDDEALHQGRRAVYSAKTVEPVPAELRAKYFEEQNGSFAFRSDLRRSVIFGRQDLIQDPPISRIDLLVSRNTLMYFVAETQERILRSFHFALRDGGFLFLGKPEVLVTRTNLFAEVDLKRRVFTKVTRAVGTPPTRPARDVEEPLLSDLAADVVVREAGFESAPVAQLVVDRQGKIALANLQARMLFGLNQRDLGRPLQELEISFRPVELRSKIEQAYADRQTVTLRDVEWQASGDIRFVDVQVVPLVAATGHAVGVGITFTDVTRNRRLQEALEESKRELETSYEELQSTNEELETTNEELQSTNEELETTNEELQSTNEELETMNEELQQRTDEVNAMNAFLGMVLSSLDAAVLVVDAEFAIEAWNNSARDLWGLRDDETIGTHLMNLDIGLPVEQLRRPIRAALAHGRRQELTITSLDRRGREIQCRVTVSALANGGVARGAIVMMEPVGT
ncbi:MAG: CheR family methyltransferase [Gaiellaceae bacterium]